MAHGVRQMTLLKSRKERRRPSVRQLTLLVLKGNLFGALTRGTPVSADDTGGGPGAPARPVVQDVKMPCADDVAVIAPHEKPAAGKVAQNRGDCGAGHRHDLRDFNLKVG